MSSHPISVQWYISIKAEPNLLQCLKAKCQNLWRELKLHYIPWWKYIVTQNMQRNTKKMACMSPILSRMLGYRKYPSKCHNSICTTSVLLLLLSKDHCVHYANSISAHDCLKTNLMKGLKRISRVLMNMVGWTMYRALMFFLYLKDKIKKDPITLSFFLNYCCIKEPLKQRHTVNL